MNADEFRHNGYALIDWIADYLEHVERYPVGSPVAPGDIRRSLPAHPPAPGTPPDHFTDVLADIDQLIMPGITHWQHPSFFAYFPGNTSYPAILGDLAASGLGVQGMSWVTSPACTEVETLMLDWMVELLGLPDRFHSTSAGGGVIQGSASEATLVSILAARWRATNGAINADGDTSRLVAYATAQAHSSIEKGLRVAGIGTDRLRIVPEGPDHAMSAEAFEALVNADLAAGLVPFWVCCTRGTTSSMAFDSLADVGPIARRAGIWVHCDAAMSGIAALAEEHRWVNDGMAFADSYCTNPHKWMGVNFDCDLFYIADRAALLGALSILPEYLRSAAAQSGAAIDYRDWQIPLGRRFRALKLWWTIRSGGVDAAVAMIRRHVALTEHLVGRIATDQRFEIVAPHPLNLVCVRLRDGDEATDRMITAANATGQALFTRTVLDGRVACRISVGGRTTETRHVDDAWDLLSSLVD